jgi:hypothetical protein
MYKVLGQRELSVLRSDRNTFVIDLRGEFDLVADDKLFPRREVVAKLILADSTLPLEVQSYLPSNEAPQPAFPGKEGAPIPPPSHLWTRELLAEPLRMAAADGYRGTLKIDPEVFEALRHPIADGQRRLAVQIEEYEIYPAAEAALGPAGGGTFTIDGVMCARRLVFSFVFEVGS